MTDAAGLTRRRLQLSDLARLSTVGLRARKLRAGLSAAEWIVSGWQSLVTTGAKYHAST